MSFSFPLNPQKLLIWPEKKNGWSSQRQEKMGADRTLWQDVHAGLNVPLWSQSALLPVSVSTIGFIAPAFSSSPPLLRRHHSLTSRPLFLGWMCFRDGLSHLKWKGEARCSHLFAPCPTSLTPFLSAFFFPLLARPNHKGGEKRLTQRRIKRTPEPRWHILQLLLLHIQVCLHSEAPQVFNCFHGISFVWRGPRDAKVNYCLAEQVQLDDNYTTAGSRGGSGPRPCGS